MSDVEEFDWGLSAGTGSQKSVIHESGPTVTTGDSWWHTRICTTCGHTFRRGDRVIVQETSGQVQHLQSGLGCAGADASDAAERGGDVLDFREGMLDAWQPAQDVTVVPAEAVPELLAPPYAGFRRARCLSCAHTFRPGELVVVCPCRQGRCVRAVHRDPTRGLVCWESWRPDGRVEVCPVLLTRMGAR